MNANIAINPFSGELVTRLDHEPKPYENPCGRMYTTEFKKMVANDYYNGKEMLTQEQLAAKWKVSQPTVGKWIHKYNPRNRTNNILTFTVNLSDLIGGK